MEAQTPVFLGGGAQSGSPSMEGLIAAFDKMSKIDARSTNGRVLDNSDKLGVVSRWTITPYERGSMNRFGIRTVSNESCIVSLCGAICLKNGVEAVFAQPRMEPGQSQVGFDVCV